MCSGDDSLISKPGSVSSAPRINIMSIVPSPSENDSEADKMCELQSKLVYVGVKEGLNLNLVYCHWNFDGSGHHREALTVNIHRNWKL